MAEPRLADLPPLREVIARYGLASRRSLGQHFLLDLNLTRKIVRAAGALDGVTAIEIGPGPGGLTRALLDSGAVRVVVVERDHRCIPALIELQAAAGDRLTIVEEDALDVDCRQLAPAPRAIVANLPYNIATPLLIGWLKDIQAFRSLTLMFQKEVADRLAAAPGGKSYGRLSVICQWRAAVRRDLTVPARAFTPPPKIDSAVVTLTPRTDPEPADWTAMERVTATAFGQRRKMLRTSLKPLGDAAALLASAALPETARAEQIDVAGYAALARALAKRKETSVG